MRKATSRDFNHFFPAAPSLRKMFWKKNLRAIEPMEKKIVFELRVPKKAKKKKVADIFVVYHSLKSFVFFSAPFRFLCNNATIPCWLHAMQRKGIFVTDEKLSQIQFKMASSFFALVFELLL